MLKTPGGGGVQGSAQKRGAVHGDAGCCENSITTYASEVSARADCLMPTSQWLRGVAEEGGWSEPGQGLPLASDILSAGREGV